jgi:hypothetical protein
MPNRASIEKRSEKGGRRRASKGQAEKVEKKELGRENERKNTQRFHKKTKVNTSKEERRGGRTERAKFCR